MKRLILGLMVVLPFSFWFFLGFPFALRMESYAWVTELNKVGFFDVLTSKLEPVATYRPLGQAVAWLGYRLSGGSIYPVELSNYLLAIVSWFVLSLAVEEKRMFSLVSMIVGGAFFSGYIYLFHLHGTFYSPLLLLVAVSFLLLRSGLTSRKIVGLSFLAVILAFFHPFALLINLSFLIGVALKSVDATSRKQCVLALLFAALPLALIMVLSPGQNLPVPSQSVAGLFTSYRTVEANSLVSIAAFALSLCTAASIDVGLRKKMLLMVATVALSLLFWLAAFPVLIVWILVCLVKMVSVKEWPIAFLIIATALFPAFTGTGSPTYSIFVLMTCAAVVPYGLSTLDGKLAFVDERFALLLLFLVLVLVLSLRLGVHVPLISRLVNPILAEKERTFQLETMINWFINSEYREYDLVLSQGALNPADSVDSALNRTHRAPTAQEYLSTYIDSLRPPQREEGNTRHYLLLSFGTDNVGDTKVVYTVEGKYAGDAVLRLPSR